MVTAAASKSYISEIVSEKDPIFLPTPIAFASVSTDIIIENEHRLDASAYILQATGSLKKIKNGKYGYVFLWSKNGLVKKAYYPGRYKRIYNEEGNGIPFYLPSQLDELYPKPTKYISEISAEQLKNDYIKKNNLLLSRSGTIGKCSISSRTTIGKLFSDDVIRITFNNPYDLGYVYTFLNTEIGLSILQSNNYGAVIDHIEPEHLRNVPIPNAPEALKKQIHELIIASFDLRDQSNELIDQAQALLYSELKLPRLSEIKPKFFKENADFVNFSISTEQLDGRIDASYHHPEVEAVIDILRKNAGELTTLGDKKIVKEIVLPGRFKRVYVDKEHGVPFFGGKQLLQLNPTNLKYLSISKHGSRIQNELTLQENMIAVTCSGTIGKVMIVPKHWKGWTLNQHCLRVVPAASNLSGFLYAWLDSPYCKPLIIRNTYGAVVDELDDIQMSHVLVPLLKDKQIQQTINDKVLQANELRYQAYQKEQEALKIMERDVLGEE